MSHHLEVPQHDPPLPQARHVVVVHVGAYHGFVVGDDWALACDGGWRVGRKLVDGSKIL